MSRNFPSFIDAFTEYAVGSGSPEKYAKWCAVSGIAAALERRSWTWMGDRCIFPNQYILLVGNSGTRKSATADLITEIIYDLRDISFMPAQMTAAAMLLSIVDAGENKQFHFDGKTYKNSSLFAYASEAATMLKENEALQELLTDFYQCGTPTFWSDKFGWTKRTVGGGKIVVFNPCLNLLGCSTAEWLNDIIGDKSIKGGFIPRFLLIEHNQKAKTGGWRSRTVNHSSRTKKKALTDDLQRINNLSGEFSQALDFKEVFDNIEKIVVDQINKEDERQPFYNRKIVHCLKVAMALSADQGDSMVVTGDHLAKAFEMVESIEADMYNCFYNRGSNKSLGQFIDCWEIIRRKDVWKRGELINATLRKCSPAELDVHLKAYVDMKKIAVIPGPGYNLFKVIDDSQI